MEECFQRAEGVLVLKKTKQVIIWIIIAIVLLLIWIYAKGDDKKQIVNEVKKHWNVTNIQHIEILDDNKSVVFYKTVDGTEREMYLEKSLFSWDNKRDFSFIREGVNEHILLSFFDSPFSNEEEYNAVLLRVFDNEINSVHIAKGEKIIYKFELFSTDSEERFGLFRTENDEIYNAEYIAYNSDGEVVYVSKPSQLDNVQKHSKH